MFFIQFKYSKTKRIAQICNVKIYEKNTTSKTDSIARNTKRVKNLIEIFISQKKNQFVLMENNEKL